MMVIMRRLITYSMRLSPLAVVPCRSQVVQTSTNSKKIMLGGAPVIYSVKVSLRLVTPCQGESTNSNLSYIFDKGNRDDNINSIDSTHPLGRDISTSDRTMQMTSGTNTNRFLSNDNTAMNTNQFLNEDDILQLKELINGDLQCNSQFDNTIITWKNIVDRTKSVAENFGTLLLLVPLPL
jgi:hypothetical protein